MVAEKTRWKWTRESAKSLVGSKTEGASGISGQCWFCSRCECENSLLYSPHISAQELFLPRKRSGPASIWHSSIYLNLNFWATKKKYVWHKKPHRTSSKQNHTFSKTCQWKHRDSGLILFRWNHIFAKANEIISTSNTQLVFTQKS